jgi:hypothetical protein
MLWTEKGFGMNDYFVIGEIIVTWSIYFLLPKIFTKQFTILLFLYTLTLASILDNSFGLIPFDYYDIMDGPKYTGMDVIVYILYPPYGYFFLFFYKRLRISDQKIILYIVIATILSVCFEWINLKMGVYHYKNGYQIAYSFCLYLLIQSILIVYYRRIEIKR